SLFGIAAMWLLVVQPALRGVRIRTDRQQELIDQAERLAQRLATIFDHSPIGIFETDPAGRCAFVNRRWTEITGVSLADTEQLGWMTGVHTDDRERVESEWLHAIERDRQLALECRWVRPGGELRWVAARAVALRDRSGKVTGYCGTIADVTA